MITYTVQTTATVGNIRDSVGGRPILPENVPLPVCECGKRMTLYFQFDIRTEFGLPFITGSHLSVFMCACHNDAPAAIYGEPLPDRFWTSRRSSMKKIRFYEILLHGPGIPEVIHSEDERLVAQGMHFSREAEEIRQEDAEGNETVVTLEPHPKYPGTSLDAGKPVRGRPGFKIGGHPSWAQDTELHTCCCGAEMRFLCQIPEDFPFRKRPEAPSQPDSFSANDYALFLGNSIYLFACESQCSQWALIPVCQN